MAPKVTGKSNQTSVKTTTKKVVTKKKEINIAKEMMKFAEDNTAAIGKEGFKALAAKFRGVAAIEKSHEERYRALLKNVEAQEVFKRSTVKVWECRNCGHIIVGTEAPAACPVCAHARSYFELRAENY